MLTFAKTNISAISVLIVFILNCDSTRALYEGSACRMKNGTRGVCVKLPECTSIEDAIRKRTFPLDDLIICAFAKNDIEVICCPDKVSNQKLTTNDPDGIVLSSYKPSTIRNQRKFEEFPNNIVTATTRRPATPSSQKVEDRFTNPVSKFTGDTGFIDLTKLIQNPTRWPSTQRNSRFTQTSASTRRPSANIRDLEETTRRPTATTTTTTDTSIFLFPGREVKEYYRENGLKRKRPTGSSSGRNPYWSGNNWREEPSSTAWYSTTKPRPIHSQIDNGIDEVDTVLLPNQNDKSDEYKDTSWYLTTPRSTSIRGNDIASSINDLENPQFGESDHESESWHQSSIDMKTTKSPRTMITPSSTWSSFVFPSSSSSSSSFSSSSWLTRTSSPRPFTNPISSISSSVLDPWMVNALLEYQNFSTSTTSTPWPVVTKPTLSSPSSLPIFPDMFSGDLNSPDYTNEISTSTRKPTNRPSPTAFNRLSERNWQSACTDYIENYRAPLDFQIFGGEPTYPGEFPHMAALGYPSSTVGVNMDFKCGGTLISDRYVLTAAHCVISRDSKPEVIRLGTIHLDEPGLDVGIENITMHPAYRSSRQYDDIALIRLNTSVNFTSYIYPACLSPDRFNESNQFVVATGWGSASKDTRRKSNILLKVNLTTIEIGECNKIHADYAENRRLPNGLNEGHLCAGDFSTRAERGDTCDGDSGGPLHLGSSNPATVVGVTSFGIVCGSDIPSVYARVATYLNWIDDIVWPDLI